MKKILSTLITLSILSAFLPIIAHAETIWYEDLIFDSETGMITGYSKTPETEPWDLVIPKTIEGVKVTGIGEHAFNGNERLRNVTLPEGITSVGEYAFAYCYNMVSIELPSSLESIGGNAFLACPFESINLPMGLKSISGGAFYNCNNLTSITVPNTVETIEYGAFMYTASLKEIWVTVGNNYYESDTSGVLFNKGKTELLKYPSANTRQQYAVPGSVKTIAKGAFESCNNLRDVTLPYGLKTIGGFVFRNCDYIQKMHIPSSVTTIGDSAFDSCDALKSLDVSDTLKTVGSMAFHDCNNLTDVYFTGNYKKWYPAIDIGNDPLKNANYICLSYIPDYEIKNLVYDKEETGNRSIIFDVESNVDERTDYVVYGAVYSSEGVLKECRLVNGRISLGNDIETHYVHLYDDAQTGDIIKAFAWDNGGKPLAVSKSIVVE